MKESNGLAIVALFSLYASRAVNATSCCMLAQMWLMEVTCLALIEAGPSSV
jgi:hypothetical protein